MRHVLRISVVAALLVAISVAPAFADGGRIALVVGNAAYETGRLRNPVNDAQAVAEELGHAGFDVRLLEDADQRELLDAVRLFGNDVARGASMAFFYFAGHGVQIDGRNFLIPVNSNIESEDEVEFFALDASLVLSKMENAGPQTNVVILDACRDNPFPSRTRSATRGLSVIPAPAGSIVVYATAPGSVAHDGDGRHGIFTEALLRHMSTPDVDIETMLRRVRADVVGASGGAQVPWSNSSITKEVTLTGNAVARRPSVPSTPTTPAVDPPPRTTPTYPRDTDIAVLLAVGNGSIAGAGVSWGIVPNRIFLNATAGVSYWSYSYGDTVDGLLATTDVEVRWDWFKGFFSPFLGVGLVGATDFDTTALSAGFTCGFRLWKISLRGALFSPALNRPRSYPSTKLGLDLRL